MFADNARTIPLAFLKAPPPPAETCDRLRQLKIPALMTYGADTRPFYRIAAEGAARCIQHGAVAIPGAVGLTAETLIGTFGDVRRAKGTSLFCANTSHRIASAIHPTMLSSSHDRGFAFRISLTSGSALARLDANRFDIRCVSPKRHDGRVRAGRDTVIGNYEGLLEAMGKSQDEIAAAIRGMLDAAGLRLG